MIPRDYRTTGEVLGANLKTMIENHPDAFEVILYLPDTANPETVAVAEDVVGSMESSERTLTYADPVDGKALKLPEQNPYEAVNAGDAADGHLAEPCVLLLNHAVVPKHTVIQYEEYTSLTDRRLVSLYVVDSTLVSQAPGSGMKHFCLPFPQFMNEGPARVYVSDSPVNDGDAPVIV